MIERGPIGVFVVDDYPVVRNGVRAIVGMQADMVIVGEAADGLVAVDAVAASRPDVVVMDVALPGLSGAEATARIKAACPQVHVLVLTAHEERSFVEKLFAQGATGYIVKRAESFELVHAIRAVAGGAFYLDAAIAQHAVAAGKRGPSPPELSEREDEVLRLIAQGYAMKEISSRLGLSSRTLETYRVRGMEKLGLKSRAELVRHAVSHGWFIEV